MRIDLRVKYQCGCCANVRTDVDLPQELSRAERTDENDRAIMKYIEENYCIERWSCKKKHRYGTMCGYEKIVEILN